MAIDDGGPPQPLATLPLRIVPQRIGYLKFILEGYDGMALVTTKNASDGEIVIRYPPSFHVDLIAIIHDGDMKINPLIQLDAN